MLTAAVVAVAALAAAAPWQPAPSLGKLRPFDEFASDPGLHAMRDELLRVTTPAGRRGWVLSKYALTGSDPRFLFRRVGGVWKLVGYATAD